jgi:hypothetical protein
VKGVSALNHIKVRICTELRDLGSKATRQVAHALATAEEVDELGHLYDEFFNTPNDVSLDVVPPASNVTFGNPTEGADPGVEVECQMREEDLADRLGFTKNCLPILFNPVRHLMGTTAWDPKHRNAIVDAGLDSLDPMLEKLALHWHQLAGVHAVVRKIFSSETSADNCTGMLLADEVGLGKTMQSLAVVAFLMDLKVRQERATPSPPLIRKLFLS